MKKKRNAIAGVLASCFALVVGVAAPVVTTPAFAQDEEGSSRRRVSQTLDPAVAKVLGPVYELMQADQFQQALAELNNLMASRGDRMKPFDRSTTLELRGSVKVNLEDFRGALRDFQAALDAGGLPPERNNNLRYYIAQLHFQLEDYRSAINGLNQWIESARTTGVTVDPNAYYLLAAAYTQITPPNWRAALRPAEQSVAGLNEPKKSNYDLLNLIYSELNENTKRADLLERMINHWPGERSYWTQLSGLYNQTGKDADAFAVLEVAYRAGLLQKEAEILTLVQYYSFYDNPYRGAKLLEREINAGAVKRNVKNLTLLSQLWSQAREHKRAIPVLREASGMSSEGELSYRLGQVLLADEQYVAAERALRAALRKGGMNQRETGDAYLLLGTAVFSQAGPGDRDIRCRARDAFVRAQNYSTTAGRARQWVAYIDAIIATEGAQDRLEWQQKLDALKDEVDRQRTSAQVCRLQGGGEDCDPLLARLEELQNEFDVLQASPPVVNTGCRATNAGGGGGAAAADADAAPARPADALNEASEDGGQ